MSATSDSSFLARYNFKVRKQIGEGSFSKVYLVKLGNEDGSSITIATKVINKNRVSPRFVEKFLPRELDLLVKLKHPYIVQVHSVLQNGYKIFINMEYAENGDLFTYLQHKTLEEPQIRSWFMQILYAFMYMHRMGVVHRDLKCENILLTRNYNVRITDFGFARFVDLGRNPGVDTACGTMLYSSPELLSGQRPYNPVLVDVWAIGIVLYTMTNNKEPFRDKNKRAMLKKQLAKKYSFRSSMIRSRRLKDLIATFLEPDCDNRTTLKDALQHPWIKEGNIKIPEDVVMANDSNRPILKNSPVITRQSLREPGYRYQLAKYEKTNSVINKRFAVLKKK
ncbi:testis-specific serine/threonine-protein kinase 3-like [Rhopalosiphum maidis]|uniref:testis-specific serine/threonine-protein kinase 3-like n=1 Tax=Rhopalosiphum maidis TaxID=43146 RepID=UPI000EFF247F|nr:testis-specific serine/threonine-protein kinase 3-like [Rhopalosiphum maidis]